MTGLFSSWRKWNRLVHRDLGYIAFGLTVIYAVSGVAVNHIADWNPNFDIETIDSVIPPAKLDPGATDSVLAAVILKETGETEPLMSTFRPSPDEFQVFVEGNTLSVDLTTGETSQKKVKERWFLHAFNFLHLNHAKEMWTWVADIYAIALVLLAITGLFMIKGPKGILGRGLWLTGLGILVPLVFLWLYYF